MFLKIDKRQKDHLNALDAILKGLLALGSS